MIKRIIFDIDGTLITGVNFEFFVRVLMEKYGIQNIIIKIGSVIDLILFEFDTLYFLEYFYL